MNHRGTAHNRVSVLPAEVNLPEGAKVIVVVSEGEPTKADSPNIWSKLAELGRKYESQPSDLSSDLAANHDHYLHGLSKRQ